MLKLLYAVFGSISDEAYCLLSGTLKTVCVMLLCSLTLLLEARPVGPDTYELYVRAAQLESNALGVLLVGNFAGLFLERQHRR